MIPYQDRGSREDIRGVVVSQNGYDKSFIRFLENLVRDYPGFRFVFGRKFAFRPPKTIVLGSYEPFSELLTLHEVSHAILRHNGFRVDVERVKLENEAWEKARELAKKYKIEVNEELIQDELDTYRDWLHKKSRCPKCGLTRFQTPDAAYHCPLCENFSPTTKK